MHPTTAILPNGRIASPAGASAFVGTQPLGIVLSPDERFIVVSNDGGAAAPGVAAPQGAPVAGSSLAVVDARTTKLTGVFRDSAAAFFIGVIAVRDPRDPRATLVLASDAGTGAVRVLHLDQYGRLTADGVIALPPSAARRAVPAGIAASPNGRYAYVVDRNADTVSTIDVALRKVLRTVPVGDAPYSVAASSSRVVVSGSGLGVYRETAAARAPAFTAPPFDAGRSSSVAVMDVAAGGTPDDDATVRMDPAPDGTRDVGGAAPGAIVLRGNLAYVALTNVDRVAVVALNEQRVARGLDLRLYPDAPYGAQPSAEALSRDGKRLYVALAGLNAVAVLDARAPSRYRYGLIPTAWYPTALALSANGRYLYVACAKGVDGWGVLTRVDLKHTSLMRATMDTLRYNRIAAPAKANAVVPPLRSGKRSSAIDRIVYIAVGTDGYDQMLGDLAASGKGNGDPSRARYPASVTPNLHALATTYAVADNFYAADADVGIARLAALDADASFGAELAARAQAATGQVFGLDDPEGYPRAGSVFNALSRAGLTFRDYGGELQLSGYRDGLYHLDVPGAAVLNGNADTAYAAADASVDDAQRASEFVRDMQRYVGASQMPSFTYVWLPTDSGANGPGAADRALGTIVDYLSHTPQWSSMAVFIVPEGVRSPGDHVHPLRSYCVVASPYAKRDYVGKTHLSVPSVVKTEEEIFGMPPLSLSDLLATDMSDFFTDAASPQPFRALR